MIFIERKSKQRINTRYNTQFKIRLSVKAIDKMSTRQVIRRLAHKRYKSLFVSAAVFIQRFWRRYAIFYLNIVFISWFRYRTRKWFGRQLVVRDQAARTIQRIWREKKSKIISPKLENLKLNKAAKKIQDCFKHFKNKRLRLSECLRKNIDEMDEYFTKLRMGLYTDSQIKIAYHYRKYKSQKVKSMPKKAKSKFKSKPKRLASQAESMFDAKFSSHYRYATYYKKNNIQNVSVNQSPSKPQSNTSFYRKNVSEVIRKVK